MSGLAELSQRLTRLTEISGIMTAMQSLALVETRKLARFIGHQRRMLANIEAATADFLTFFPNTRTAEIQPAILVLIGSERGFCGNFNERILTTLADLPDWQPSPALVVVGHRLETKLADNPDVITRLAGPTMTEEVPAVLNRLIDALHAASRQLAGNGATLFTLAHNAEGEPARHRLLPLPAFTAPSLGHPPRLHLAPPAFLAELLDHYLLSALYGRLYESLLAENRQRLTHMEHAIDRLTETVNGLTLKRNARRQEKIVEEIEVILSSELAFSEGSISGAGAVRSNQTFSRRTT